MTYKNMSVVAVRYDRCDNNKSSDALNKITACVEFKLRMSMPDSEWILHDMMWRQKHHQHINIC